MNIILENRIMKINEINKEFGRVKYVLCGHYWKNYDSFENIQDSVMFIQVNRQET